MKRTLTRSEMLALWRNYRTGEPLRLDCTVERTDGTDYDALLTAEMRAWYLELLDSADEALLAPVELAAQAAVGSAPSGVVTVTAPADVRRIVRLQFAGWGAPVEPVAAPAAVARAAANPYCRRPVAARLSPRQVAVGGARGALTSLVCAVDPGPESYILDDKALDFNEHHGKHSSN